MILDYEQYRQNIVWAYNSAMNLAVNAGFITKQSLSVILTNAHQFALNLSVNSGFLTNKSLPLILSKAVQGSLSVASAIAEKDSGALSEKVHAKLSVAPKAQSVEVVKEDKKEEPEEEEEPEEDLGLGSLFG